MAGVGAALARDDRGDAVGSSEQTHHAAIGFRDKRSG
jgi:hypothetical protein